MNINAKQSLHGKANIGYALKGEDGATFIPEIDGDGNLRWSNDKNLDNPEIVNIKGPKGDKGDKGDTGEPITVNGVAPDKDGNIEIRILPNNAEQINMLIEADMLPAIHAVNGAILTDEKGNIILRY